MSVVESQFAALKVYSPHYVDERGGLHCVEGCRDIPFEVKRVFWIDAVPMGASRGCHAHWSCHEALFAVHGSFVVEVDDGAEAYTFKLSNDGVGVLIPAGVWCELREFSADAVCLVMASEGYDADGYVHSKEQWRAMLKAKCS